MGILLKENNLKNLPKFYSTMSLDKILFHEKGVIS